MINIRQEVFETNSSSTHSVSSVGSSRMTLPPPGQYRVTGGEYGWGYDTLFSWSDKLNYVVSYIYSFYRGRSQYYGQPLKEMEQTDYYIWLKDMVMTYAGIELELVPLHEDDTYYMYGYVDHQSEGCLSGYWYEDEQPFKDNMRDLIFDESVFITIDNDN